MALVTRFIPDIPRGRARDFDLKGFLLIGPGLSMFLTGATLLGLDLVTRQTVVAGAPCGGAVAHAMATSGTRCSSREPLIDLQACSTMPTFFAGVAGGFLFRIGIGAAPFLLPLLFQGASA